MSLDEDEKVDGGGRNDPGEENNDVRSSLLLQRPEETSRGAERLNSDQPPPTGHMLRTQPAGTL